MNYTFSDGCILPKLSALNVKISDGDLLGTLKVKLSDYCIIHTLRTLEGWNSEIV